MKTSTIAEAKNNSSNLIHQLESEEAIHLTRHCKPGVVMMSEDQYQNLIVPNKSVNTAILNWQSQLAGNVDIELSDNELKTLRKDSAGRELMDVHCCRIQKENRSYSPIYQCYWITV